MLLTLEIANNLEWKTSAQCSASAKMQGLCHLCHYKGRNMNQKFLGFSYCCHKYRALAGGNKWQDPYRTVRKHHWGLIIHSSRENTVRGKQLFEPQLQIFLPLNLNNPVEVMGCPLKTGRRKQGVEFLVLVVIYFGVLVLFWGGLFMFGSFF